MDAHLDAQRHQRLIAWLGLMARDGVGAARLWQVALDGGPTALWDRTSTPSERARACEFAAKHCALGIAWTEFGDDAHPTVVPGDPHVPPVLMWRGSVAPSSERPLTVGIVGTRRASRLGLEIATELGEACTRAGVRVVSGLAAGIDAAAHRGALRGLARCVGLERHGAVPTPLAVVGTGLDVTYPRRNAELWADVAQHGSICSEYPLGTEAAPWRFPARNRILVALSDLIVVVESSDRGGSLITAGIAAERGVPVMAVPGSIRSPNAVGTNRLLADGCAPCLGADDVLMALGLGRQLLFDDIDDLDTSRHSALVEDPVEVEVLTAVGWEPTSTEVVANRCPERSLGELLSAVQALVRRGILTDRGGWLERLR